MRRKSLALILVATSAGLLLAQDDNNADPGPGRSVARISVINGDVSVRRGDSADVVAAALNAPLVAQDRLLTSSSSRVEVQFDSANVLRAGANSEIRFTGLDSKNYQLQVATGIITFTVLRPNEAQVELDTPSVSIKPLKNGAYRVTVREDGSSEITVRAGEAEIFSPQGSQRLEQGQTMMARGNPADPEFQVVQAGQVDSWDRWNADRDQYLTRARSRQYVSPDVYGAEDLDQHGRWLNDPTYGNVWAPTVAPGWAPYQDGRWVWEDFYGWTWVSNDPWGWAPYHYGRWFNGPVGWCWYPGPIYGRHFWSPAIVGFFGWGGGIGFGFGFGNVGWVPLAPFEPFHRWWGPGFGGRGFVNNTTIINNVNIANTYRNARVANGVTGVSASQFGRQTGRFTPVNAEQVRSAGLMRGGVPVTPDRASLRFADRPVNAASFPQTRNERFFTHNQPVASQRTPFEQQQRSLEPTLGRGAAAGANAQGVGGAHQWSRFGEPIHGNGGGNPGVAPPARVQESFNNGRGANAPATGSLNSGNSGWRRFGAPSGGTSSSSRPVEVAPRSVERPQNEPSQRAPAAANNFAPRGGLTTGGGWGAGSAPVRIAPPIVRERTPSYGGGSYHPAPSYGGGSYHPAPSYGGGSSRPAPSFGGGGGGGRPSGGGGGSHSSGGGGGGHSSSGGGGHHGR